LVEGISWVTWFSGKVIEIQLMKGQALRKHSLHEKNSSLGFIEAVHP